MDLRNAGPVMSREASAEEIEPRIAELMALKLERRGSGPYHALNSLLLERHVSTIPGLVGEGRALQTFRRMAGGASKEQFTFEVAGVDATERFVLRVDPLEAIVETCRFREAELVDALAGVVPLASVRWVDGLGEHLGQPGMITTFVSGVTKPPNDGMVSRSGVGTVFTGFWRERLANQFVKHLVAIHGFDWRHARLDHFAAPTGAATKPALWQVNWWSQVWREDVQSPYPILTLAEQWMRRNLPECDELVVVHGDYRTGNFMFDAVTAEFTAVLDWELAHIGDFHEDLGWIVQRLFAGTAENGDVFVCSLMSRENLIAAYEALTGRHVNRRTLAFYEIFAAYKCAVMNLATGAGIARRRNNHQDVFLSWLAPVGNVFAVELARLIEEESRS